MWKKRQIILLAALLVFPSAAMAAGDKLKIACGADYAAYCSTYKVTSPPSASLRACMRSHRHQLLEKCIRALEGSSLKTRH
jgi:hypothetical protein